ncbi:hypothetical protein FSP39_014702 [Pinctada imbricata]|uniref:Uncharacterized protein n=1 Tax=Pinctada imbricata TaxID=66713 RepID=A0AA88Y4X7_PINIB|nr:hypothetical protein FSP39_014702 [Pinctada imbricata]
MGGTTKEYTLCPEQNRPAPKTPTAEEYDPSQPELHRMNIISISLLPGALSAILDGDGKRYKCHLDDGLLLDSKSVTSISRKLAFLTPCEEEQCGQFLQQANDIVARCISSTLGVDPRFILRVDVTDLRNAFGPSDATEPELDLFAESDFNMGSPAPSERIVQMATPPYHPTPLDSGTIKPSTQKETEKQPSSQEKPNERPPSPKKKKIEEPAKEKENKYEPKTKATTKEQSLSLVPPAKSLEVLSSSHTHSQSDISRKRPLSSVVKVVKKKPVTTKSANIPTSAGDCSTVARNQGSLQNRAKNLLARGCLPLMPPARRQWADTQVTLTNGSTSVTWPPVNWKELSKDQRLLELEYVAMTLTRATSGHQPFVERAELFEVFNFLALPGTVPLSPKKIQKPHFKSRFYMYQAIRMVAISETTSSSDEELVSFLEGGCHRRRRTWEHLISAVDAAGIPLRLKEEN